jgi:hypothetical protein
MDMQFIYWVGGILVAAVCALWAQNVIGGRHCRQENARLNTKVDENHKEILTVKDQYATKLEVMHSEQIKVLSSLDNTLHQCSETQRVTIKTLKKYDSSAEIPAMSDGDTTRVISNKPKGK